MTKEGRFVMKLLNYYVAYRDYLAEKKRNHDYHWIEECQESIPGLLDFIVTHGEPISKPVETTKKRDD